MENTNVSVAQKMENFRAMCSEIPAELENDLSVTVNIEEFLKALNLISDLFISEEDSQLKYEVIFVVEPNEFRLVVRGMSASCSYPIKDCEIEGCSRINMFQVNINAILARLSSITRFRQQEMTTLTLQIFEAKRASALMRGSKQKLAIVFGLSSRDKKRDNLEDWETVSQDAYSIKYITKVEDRVKVLQNYDDINFNILVSEDLKFYLDCLPVLSPKDTFYLRKNVAYSGDTSHCTLCLNTLPNELKEKGLAVGFIKLLYRALSLSDVIEVGIFEQTSRKWLCLKIDSIYISILFKDMEGADVINGEIYNNTICINPDADNLFEAESPEEFLGMVYRDYGFIVDKRDFYDKVSSIAKVCEGRNITIEYQSNGMLSIKCIDSNSGAFSDFCNVIAEKGMDNTSAVSFNISSSYIIQLYPKIAETFDNNMFIYLIPKRDVREKLFTDEDMTENAVGFLMTDSSGNWLSASTCKMVKRGRKEA